jgi:DNA-directed RNA polymerase subunit RPC12/RpoP
MLEVQDTHGVTPASRIPMIRFQCPTCKAVLSAPDEKAHARSSCPRCGQRVQIPSNPTTKPRRNRTVLGSLLSPFTGSKRPETQRSATIPVKCPGCDRVIPLEANELGLTIECTRCKMRFVAVPPSANSPFPAPSPPASLEPPQQEQRDDARDQGDNFSFQLVLLGILGMILLALLGCVVGGIWLYQKGGSLFQGTGKQVSTTRFVEDLDPEGASCYGRIVARNWFRDPSRQPAKARMVSDNNARAGRGLVRLTEPVPCYEAW